MKLYFKFFAVHIRSAMQYKTSFFLSAIGQFLTSFSALVGVYFLLRRFGNIDGYTFAEVLICYSVALFGFTSAETFFRGFDAFSSVISNGEFDRVMVRPRSPMFLVLCSRLEIARIGRFLQAAAMLAYAIPRCQIEWTAMKIFTLVLMCLGGAALFSGLFMIYASLCFYTTEGLEFMNIFTDGGRELGKYPIEIYGDGLLRFYTFIIPLACVQFWPFTYIIGRSDSIVRAFAPIAGFLFLIPCILLWRLGVSHFKSTGS